MKTKRKIFVISGASGAGKDTITSILAEKYKDISISPSVTTREQGTGDNKPGGKIYTYVSIKRFEEMIEEGFFFEYKKINGHYYGTPKSEVFDLIEKGYKVLLILDVDGGLEMKQRFPESVLIFLKAPSIEILKDRLIKRNRDSAEEIKKRLKRIDYENAKGNYYDYIVVNDILEKTIKEVASIIFDGKMV